MASLHRSKQGKVIRWLLARGARLDLRDKEHDGTPYDWAVYHGHQRAAFLKEAAAS